MSIRFDPLRDNNTSIVDLIYYDENDGTPGYSHHATVYYKALYLFSQFPDIVDYPYEPYLFSGPRRGQSSIEHRQYL